MTMYEWSSLVSKSRNEIPGVSKFAWTLITTWQAGVLSHPPWHQTTARQRGRAFAKLRRGDHTSVNNIAFSETRRFDTMATQ
jgi:hypothetical protein